MAVVINDYGWGPAAVTELQRAIQIDPNYADAHFNLALMYLEQEPPATELARAAIRSWIQRRQKAALHESIARYAASWSASEIDIDAEPSWYTMHPVAAGVADEPPSPFRRASASLKRVASGSLPCPPYPCTCLAP